MKKIILLATIVVGLSATKVSLAGNNCGSWAAGEFYNSTPNWVMVRGDSKTKLYYFDWVRGSRNSSQRASDIGMCDTDFFWSPITVYDYYGRRLYPVNRRFKISFLTGYCDYSATYYDGKRRKTCGIR